MEFVGGCVWSVGGDVWYGVAAGEELSADGGEQNRIHDTVGVHIPVREPAVPDIPEPDGGGVELPRGAGDVIRGPPAMVSRLQHEQHIHHERAGSDHLVLQSAPRQLCGGR